MKPESGHREHPLRRESAFAWLLGELADLSPAYFGMVMATGIVAIAAGLLDMAVVARALFALGVAAYLVLWVLTLLRVIYYRRRLVADLFDHLRGPGFFTTVAATSIVGTQFVVLASDDRIATLLWTVAIVLWVGLTYAIFAGLTVKPHKPTLDQGINGGWLLAVVATQSIAALSALLAAHIGQPVKLELNFFALSMWLWGGMLYIWMMSLIFYRYTFFTLAPDDLSPPYWINMGAVAISTLAGATLFEHLPLVPALADLAPFIKGFTIFYWAMGTWWIPMLLVLGVWRYLLREFPLSYDPLYWGGVFPLGMYCVSTLRLGETVQLPFLATLSRVFLYLAVAAWTATLAGLADTLIPWCPARAAAGQRDR